MEERVGALPGGYALYNDGEPALGPGCCCDLSDINEWERVMAKAAPEWESLIIGHASMSVRVRAETLELRDVSETTPPSVDDVAMSRASAMLALEDASAQQRFLEARVSAALREVPQLATYSEEQFALLGRLLVGRAS